jgi:hypothetical protein
MSKSMKYLILLAIIFACPLAFGEWKLGGKKLDVVKCPERSCLISRVCPTEKCLAAKALAQPQKGAVGEGGKNPGSGVCTNHHKANVIIGVSDKGSTQAFCHFSDGSLLSLDGLWHW